MRPRSQEPPITRSLRTLLLLAIFPALGGCGGDEGQSGDTGSETTGTTAGTATFDEPDFEVTFEYPAEFQAVDDISFNRAAGSGSAATAGVGLDSANLLALQRFDLSIEVGKRNLERVRPEADKLFSELARKRVEGEEVEVGDLPALQYELALTEPPDAETRATAIFDGDVEYLLNCQSTPERRAEVEEACDTALETLEPE